MAVFDGIRHPYLTAVVAVGAAIAVSLVAAPSPSRADNDRPAPTDTWQAQRPDERRPPAPTPGDGSGGFVYRMGRFTPLSPIPDAGISITCSINNQGQTTGLYVAADAAPGPDGSLPTGTVHGFVRDGRGDITSFDVADAEYTRSLGINNRGQVAGDHADAGSTLGPDGLRPPGSLHGFVRDPRGDITTFDVPFRLHAIRGLNDRGQIVGYYDNRDHAQGGFVREPDGRITLIDVPGASSTQVYAINGRGQVVGAHLEPGAALGPDGAALPGTVHGFVWERGRFTSLDGPGSTLTQPFGINNRGQITGGYRDATGTQHGFLLDRGRYETIDAPGRIETVGTIATSINDMGDVVIPEPGEGVLPVAT